MVASRCGLCLPSYRWPTSAFTTCAATASETFGATTTPALAALERREKRLLDLCEHDGIDLHEHTARREVIKAERAVLQHALANAIAVPVVPTEAAIRAEAEAWRWNAEWPPEQKRKWLADHPKKPT